MVILSARHKAQRYQMTISKNLNQILNRIKKGQQNDEDIAVLRQRLLAEDGQVATQLGKYNVNIGEAKDIQIGDRTYLEFQGKLI